MFASSNNDNYLYSLSKDQFELIKCEFCDDHIKRRFIEVKDSFFKIFKNYIKSIKLIKNKDENALKMLIKETGHAQKEFLNNRNLLEKLISYRLSCSSDKSLDKLEYNPNSKQIIIQGLEERERKEFFEEMNVRKERLKTFRKNINELEIMTKNILDALEAISLSNCLVNNNN